MAAYPLLLRVSEKVDMAVMLARCGNAWGLSWVFWLMMVPNPQPSTLSVSSSRILVPSAA